MMLGRLDAPRHISYDDDLGDGFGSEFVFRQPVSEAETEDLVAAASMEPYGGYGWDGDDHWTPETVRTWWRERARVREWALTIAADWSTRDSGRHRDHYLDAARGHRAFLAHLDDGLEEYLRGYVFWLDHGRTRHRWERLPRL